MIHDAIVPVTCDNRDHNNGCRTMIELLVSLTAIEKKLRHRGWIVKNGKHYCCQECVDEAEDDG